MKRTEGSKNQYNKRLQDFLKEIDTVANLNGPNSPLHDIMDSVPFKDLETALMMARLEQDPSYAVNA